MPKDRDDLLLEKLDTIISLLQHLLVLQLAEKGVSQQAIAKRIHVAKASVVGMLKGVERDQLR